jgi:3-isopropylmalate/(R)-2-methylmalate dehydratase large subunit
MGMTVTEKILADHAVQAPCGAGKQTVRAGEIVNVRLDLLVGNDVTTPIAVEQFRKMGAEKVFDREKIVLVPSHYLPAKDIRAAEMGKQMREFAAEQGIVHYFEVGRMGIDHAIVPGEGLVVPGDCVIGADSHTCTYGGMGAFSTGVGSTDLAAAMALGETWFRVPETARFVLHGKRRPWVVGKDLILHIIGTIGVSGALYQAMEFTGETVASLPMHDRFTMCNMAIEAGAKSGIIEADDTTLDWVRPRAKRPPRIFRSDPDASYAAVYDFDVSEIEPLVARPARPDNTVAVSQLGEVRIDQAAIGSCTNGWIEDMRAAAAVLKGRKVHPSVRLIVFPASQEIYRQCLEEGLAQIFAEAEAVFSTPTCGPCIGGHMGVLAEGEVCISTTNRNFVGRMGHPKSQVYLANPAVAAASAVLGKIGTPAELGMTAEDSYALE